MFGCRLILLFCLMTITFMCAADDNFEKSMDQGKVYLLEGQFNLALDTAQSASQSASTPEQRTQAVGFLGLIYFQMHRYEQANVLLRKAIGLGLGKPTDRARWSATMANLESTRGHTEDARHLYADALKLAGTDLVLKTNIRLGQATLLGPKQRLAELQNILSNLGEISNPADRSRFLVNIGSQASSLGEGGVKLAYDSFEQARQMAAQQPRLLAEALSGLAQLYEDGQRQEEALHLNDQAIKAAQPVDARDLLLELEWRKGRLHRALKEPDEALAAYQRAVDHIEAIRQDIPVEYSGVRSSFRETLEPIYLGLSDLQLQLAKQQQGVQQTQLLRRARESVEAIKQSEMEDFLGGRCAVASSKNALLENVEPHTAIIYPVILTDRLEVLVSLGGEIQLFTQAVNAATIQSTTRKFAKTLRDGTDEAKSYARQLHHWLIEPAESWLRQHQVQTLVVVPDGVLRLIPFAALYDGNHYLIEQYALATSPGLTVLDPMSIHQFGVKSLLVGLSEPGPVVEHLPPTFVQALADSREEGIQRGNHGLSRALTISLNDAGNASPINRMVSEPAFNRALRKQLSLPGVGKEIDSLRLLMPNTSLLNERFTVSNFKQLAVQEHYPIVHIASHGVFRDTAEASFIMAYDDVIHFDDLERLFKSDKFKNQPLELLTLSACQTAEGDERAPLGLSGIAIKAKVRSALGTLWPVADEAAYRLMVEFYKRLLQPETGKAQALRMAQLELLKDKQFEHPYFWSPFILVGNWL